MMKAVLRIDMSEYMERHAVSRLIGALPDMLAMRKKPDRSCSPQTLSGRAV